MPWKEMSMMPERLEFVTLAIVEGANLSELCRRYGICRVSGAYRYRERERRRRKACTRCVIASIESGKWT